MERHLLQDRGQQLLVQRCPQRGLPTGEFTLQSLTSKSLDKPNSHCEGWELDPHPASPLLRTPLSHRPVASVALEGAGHSVGTWGSRP